jgi:hypothetical protein
MFHVGQKVVCVNDSSYAVLGWFPGEGLKKWAVYTVRGTGVAIDGGPGVGLNELILTGGAKDQDLYYMASRFRPITERKTDISVFTEILDKVTNGDRKLIEA